MVIVLIGVAGAGKTTTGWRLSAALGWPFFDGDDYHPPANVEKMRRRIPLTDGDREGWLDALHALIAGLVRDGRDAIVACSALKRGYRARLTGGMPGVSLVYLKVPPGPAFDRLAHRGGHFMPPDLVASQFAALEEPSPAEALIVDATLPADEVLTRLERALGVSRGDSGVKPA